MCTPPPCRLDALGLASPDPPLIRVVATPVTDAPFVRFVLVVALLRPGRRPGLDVWFIPPLGAGDVEVGGELLAPPRDVGVIERVELVH